MRTRITVLGAGPGGYVAALRAAQLGAEVTLIEKDAVGGTCLNRGCIPSKLMKTAAEILEHSHNAAQFGVVPSGPMKLDLQKWMQKKNQVIKNQVNGIHTLLQRHQVRFVAGEGLIDKPGHVIVRQNDGTIQEIAWDRLILATGAEPLGLPNIPFDGRRIISSNELLNLESIPETMVIVGGGVIGCEFACIMAAFGVKVTIIETFSRLLPLPSIDKDSSKVLQRELKKRKIHFHINQAVRRIDLNGDNLEVAIGPSIGSMDFHGSEPLELILKAGQVLVCVGRSANTSNIGGENIGLHCDAKGWIPVDEHMQTAVPGVFAIGDVLGPSKVMVAHVAVMEGIISAENAIGQNTRMDYSAVPSAIFTIPEVASVGLSEDQAGELGMATRTDIVLFRNLGKAHVTGEIAGQAKIISARDSGRVIGVHLIGPHATELIAEGTLAIQTGRTVVELAQTIHAHPTLSEIMFETALKAMDRPLHG